MEDAVQTKVQAEVQRRQAQDQVQVTKSKFSDLSKKNSQEESHGGSDVSFSVCLPANPIFFKLILYILFLFFIYFTQICD